MTKIKIIEPSYNILKNWHGAVKIEYIGHVCYQIRKATNKKTAKEFIRKRLTSNPKHESIMEHENLIYKVSGDVYDCLQTIMITSDLIKYTEENCIPMLRLTCYKERHIVSGNVRSFRNLMRLIAEIKRQDLYTTYEDVYKYICYTLISKYPEYFPDLIDENVKLERLPPTMFTGRQLIYMSIIDPSTLSRKEQFIHESVTVRFNHNRGFTHELVRHRLMSFMQESTRYVNYNKNGFTFVKPYWINIDCQELEIHINKKLTIYPYIQPYMEWSGSTRIDIQTYKSLIEGKILPQGARGKLPIDTKSTIFATAPLFEWRNVFRLRAKGAHPDMVRVMKPLLKEFGNYHRIFIDLYNELYPFKSLPRQEIIN